MKLKNLLSEELLVESVLQILDDVMTIPEQNIDVISMLTLYKNIYDSTKRGIIELSAFYKADDTRLTELVNQLKHRFPDEFHAISININKLIQANKIKSHIGSLISFFKGMENNADLKPKTKQGPSLPSKSILQKSKLRMR